MTKPALAPPLPPEFAAILRTTDCGTCPLCGADLTPADIRESHAIETASGEWAVLCAVCDEEIQ